MLAYLHVKNIALIEELEIDFVNGLNILTGETGAGKSIILGSIHYVLGSKVKKDFIRTGAKGAFVECIFDLRNNVKDKQVVNKLLEKYGINQDEDGIIVSRKTALNGRSVFRINQEVVRRHVIVELAAFLIDIHSQHEHQSLLSTSRQLDLLDRFSGKKMEELLNEYQIVYKDYNRLKDLLNEEYLDDEKRRREIAFLEFEIDEIEKAMLVEDEDSELQHRYDKLSHQKQIVDGVDRIHNDLYERADTGYLVSSAIGELGKLLEYDNDLFPIHDGLNQLEDLLSTLKRDMMRYLEGVSNYEEELYECSSRLDIINQLKLKYGDTIKEIMDYLNQKKLEHDKLVDFEKNLRETKKAIKESEQELFRLTDRMSHLRKENAIRLSETVTLALRELNLEQAVFKLDLKKEDHFTSKGVDTVEFLITTNKGESTKPLKEVASGGELSRVMLAVKSVLADVDDVDTLVFDEIDTGISGLTAQKVAEKMVGLARDRQLICITHLPQIAAMADQHYLIKKTADDKATTTTMLPMSEVESVQEIARMLSGAITSDIVLANAKEMKEYAKSIKS